MSENLGTPSSTITAPEIGAPVFLSLTVKVCQIGVFSIAATCAINSSPLALSSASYSALLAYIFTPASCKLLIKSSDKVSCNSLEVATAVIDFSFCLLLIFFSISSAKTIIGDCNNINIIINITTAEIILLIFVICNLLIQFI